jgi:ABC-type branched-subunit amino acid transport system ATPase component
MGDTPLDEIILSTQGISMLFPGTIALDNVDYRVWRGKVNVIIGENGAGKSTLAYFCLTNTLSALSVWTPLILRSISQESSNVTIGNAARS